MRVADRMTKNVKICTPETTLHEARDILREAKIRRLPVLEDDVLVGIITDRDIRSFLLPTDLPDRLVDRLNLLKVRRVKEMMTPEPLTIGPEASVERAADILRRKKYGGMPVIEDGKLVGIITQGDLLVGFLDGLGALRTSFRFTIDVPRDKYDVLLKCLQLAASQRAVVLGILSDLKIARNRNLIRYTIRLARVAPEKFIPALKGIGVEAFDIVTESVDEES